MEMVFYSKERDFKFFSSISVYQMCVDLIAQKVNHACEIIFID